MGWNFDNSYYKLPRHFFSFARPDTVPNPRLIMINHALACELGLDFHHMKTTELAALFSGNQLPPGAEPIAQAYAGHQFGYFTFLGDGRAHLIGEHLSPKGARFDIQLKGSGQTPYGLRGDGKATLGPMLREYLISEAMHALGIPSTRSLAVVTTGESIHRDTNLPGAVLTRVASSHIRIGTFEYLSAQKDFNGLKKLADYTLARHYPAALTTDNPYLSLLEEVIKKHSVLIVDWMRVGFIHGVMNTDNMAISGETIDYGPCAFMDFYDPKTVFSAIDQLGRYSYGNQPSMTQWNLARFAETLIPLLHPDETKAIELARQSIDEFSTLYQKQWLAMMRGKLGLFNEQPQDQQLITDFLHLMKKNKADYTNTFRSLNDQEAFLNDPTFQSWYERWQVRRQYNDESKTSAKASMNACNPFIIPRNHQVEYALNEALHHNMKPFNALLAALQTPYQQHDAAKPYQSPPTAAECIHHTFCGT